MAYNNNGGGCGGGHRSGRGDLKKKKKDGFNKDSEIKKEKFTKKITFTFREPKETK